MTHGVARSFADFSVHFDSFISAAAFLSSLTASSPECRIGSEKIGSS